MVLLTTWVSIQANILLSVAVTTLTIHLILVYLIAFCYPISNDYMIISIVVITFISKSHFVNIFQFYLKYPYFTCHYYKDHTGQHYFHIC